MQFILFIKGDYQQLRHLSPKDMQIDLEKSTHFIQSLHDQGKMKYGEALDRFAVLIKKVGDKFIETTATRGDDELVSLMCIETKNLQEAIEVAKSDPRFDQPGWKIEVIPVME